jgi:phosphatidylethanolamine-binding protein (PEBP) family uncharacterized protein
MLLGPSFRYPVRRFYSLSRSLVDDFAVTISPPSVMLTAPPSTSELLLIMFDLDTPYGLANHSLAPYLHWLQPSIPSSGLSLASSNATQAPVAPYLHPQPPPISPPHRFVVLVYRQPQARFSMPPGWTGFGVEQNRSNFDVEAFQTAAGLGKPIAGTWFRVAPASSSAGNSSATASTAGISSASATSSTSTGNARTFAKAPLLIGSVMVAMVLLPGLLK